ncbi:hypothetical protein SBV1_370037 [Verrucomicrobia bacterium]|nr:hypothetical protein SBV1_370037 [Verrucomicrobiota bacterium]
MSPSPESTCPLCSQVLPHEQLYQHIATEHPRLRHNTIKVIQAYHPDWHADDGACEPCWKSFRDASQVLDLMKRSKPHESGDPWTHAETAVGHSAHEQPLHPDAD